MAERQAFLEHIREQAARGRAHRVALNPHASAEAAYVGGGNDPVATLLTEWRSVGGQGTRVTGLPAARQELARFLAEHACRRVLHWGHPLLERLGLRDVCREAGAESFNWPELGADDAGLRWEQAFAADLGVTSVDWAVAETGSLALCSRAAQGRVVSLLPKRYLAVLEPSQIVPDLFDLFQRLEEIKAELPSNIVLVTGPSKTGDIELKLTTGVHGPGDVHLLIVE